MIKVEGTHFKDQYGRTLLLRGINLSGSSKIPTQPNGATHIREHFFNHRDVSFVGRPFSLTEADQHFQRLQAWGFTFLRLLVTWEAIEHAGPGIYDEEYLDSMYSIVRRAGDFGISLFIDPHQDVWSRFTGGDGAPGWTLEAAGFDMTHFEETGAAIVHATHKEPLPKMIWPTNGSKLAAATMFTLFFGGNDFAPNTFIEGVPAQEYLQRHYIQAIQQLALRLKDLPNVVGYDTMNEPLGGYLGWKDLNLPGGTLLIGPCPTPFQAMLLGSGIPQEVGVWKVKLASIQRNGTQLLNPGGQTAWMEGSSCIWRQNGVWDFDAAGVPCLLHPDYFAKHNGKDVNVVQDYYRPFANRFAEGIRAVDPRALIFIEAGYFPPVWEESDARNIVYAPHWYDGFTLVRKEYNPLIAADFYHQKPVFGPWAIRRSFAQQLASMKECGANMCDSPTLLGEFGIPMDLDHKYAYRTGDFRSQIKALDRVFQALEANRMNSTIWNYTPDNSNQYGDLWNDEDFSLFSPDQQTNPADINSGGRALPAVVRPYPIATAGEPLKIKFELKGRIFTFEFHHHRRVSAPTEIFVPNLHYPNGYQVEVSDGTYEIQRDTQRFIYHHGPDLSVHTIRIKP